MVDVAKVISFEKWRKPIKAAIALLVALVMTFSDQCRAQIGQASLLVSISVVLYFPSRTIGVVLEDVVFGTLGALIGVGYSCLAMYLADLARSDSNPSPVQAGSSGVLAAFLAVATFILNYIRLKFPRANFPTITASILISFSLTQMSVVPGFYPQILWMFMKPLAIGGGIVFAVSAFIWPDDSITNYMAVLLKCLEGHSSFFKEHSDTFLSLSSKSLDTTLPSLHDRLQGSTLLLIDCKRAVHRDILYSRLSGKDISKLTQMVKDMRNPLHGIGLCQILKGNFQNKMQMDEKDAQAEQEVLFDVIRELQSILEQLSDTCHDTLNDCIVRLKGFHTSAARTTLNSFLWPFPRLFSSNIFKKKKKTDDEYHDVQHTDSQQLKSLINELNQRADVCVRQLWALHPDKPLKRHMGALNLFSTYRFNLTEYAKCLAALVEYTEELERTRTKRRIWMPAVKSLRKYFRSGEIDPHMGSGEAIESKPMDGMTLARVPIRQNSLIGTENMSGFVKQTGSGKLYRRDPDVDPPATAFQRLCYSLYLFRNWFLEADTFLAFKTTVGTLLLALPVYLPQTAAWYLAQHGQWAMIILMMWMFPMSGMFFYTIIMRVLGTCAGGVLAIVGWEIAQGNPYGLAVVIFIFATFFYYCLINIAPARVLAIMTLITMVMIICYEYQFVHDGLGGDPVWTLAGKRMLLVIIGVAAAAILSMIPYPVNGRVELRKRLAETLRDISTMYSLLTSQFFVKVNKLSDVQLKAIRHLAMDLQRQVADERTFLKLAIFEPPLRGRFPSKTYADLVDRVENMISLVYDMAYALKDVDPVWREQVALSGTKERRDYHASILTTMKLLSSTMAAKMSLPPYMVSPQEASERYTSLLYDKFRNSSDSISHPHYFNYSAYVVSSAAFVDELTHVLSSIEDLVGVEDPSEWLKLHL